MIKYILANSKIMYNLGAILIPIMTLLILTLLSNPSAPPSMAQTTNNETKEKTEESSQTQKPFFFLFNSELPAFNVTEFPPDVFSQTTLEVNEGDEVTVYMYNQEAPNADRHSFTINAPYNVNLDLAPGKNGNVTINAGQAGIYRFYCEYHEPTMSGQLIVWPKG